MTASRFRFLPSLLATACLCVTAAAQFTVTGSGPVPTKISGGLTIAGEDAPTSRTRSSLTAAPSSPPRNLGTFDIVIVPGAGLAGNAAALAAFNRAAQAWESRIADPITVTINSDLAPLGAGIIGSANSVTLQGEYNEIRDQLVSDAALDIGDAITASLPTAAQLTITKPTGTTYDGTLLGTKANLKAMGFTGLDAAFGVSDGTITFSSNFSFDYDNSNGVGAGMMDFETVAIHEIGHALGFFSIVDSVNDGDLIFGLSTLDLFRFANNTAADPTTAAEFTTFARNLVPGTDAITDQIIGTTTEWRMSTGLASSFAGTDGRQASHWKADELTGDYIGMLDPTLGYGVVQALTEADFRAMDLIGYDVYPVPEFSNALFGAACVVASLGARRRRMAVVCR